VVTVLDESIHLVRIDNNNKHKGSIMKSDQILMIVGLLAAIGATLAPDAMAYWGLALLLIGLVSGFMGDALDQGARVAMMVAAVTLPAIANGLDTIPGVGAQLNGIIDNMALVIGGVVIWNFILVVKDGVMPAGD
jgi:hypothetical protein